MGIFSYFFNSYSRKNLKKIDKIVEQIERLESKYQIMTNAQLQEQTTILKGRLAKGETLEDILPDAFAVVREAANRVLKMKHFRVQLIGGIALHQGRIAEMRTGEGKTLVSTLPAYLNALTGEGVHIVTVNDYLAKRDAEWMGKVHRFLGLTVGVILHGQSDDEKRAAYACDITYATNNELGFDYLRDNLKTDLTAMVQRKLNYAIIDEVDSILIDEARTPLIISGQGDKSSELYAVVDKFIRQLKGGYEENGIRVEAEGEDRVQKALDKAEGKVEEEQDFSDWDFTIDRKDRSVLLTEVGAEKVEKFFNIANMGDIEHADLHHHIQQALKAHKLFQRDEHYIIQKDEVVLVDEFTGRIMPGRRYSDGLHQAIEAKEGVQVRNENKTFATITFQNYFRLYKKLSGMTGTAKTEEGEFKTIYHLDVLEIPTNKKIQRVDKVDKIFPTVDGKKRAILQEILRRHETGQPILIGTASVEKSEEIAKVLRKNNIKHNILNAKNHEREAEIIAQAGRLGAVTISTNMAGRGTDILLGGNPEYLAKKHLRDKGIPPEQIEIASSYAELTGTEKELQERYQNLLKEYEKETAKEKEEVIRAGGLCILGTERYESRRIDNQLRGRAGRQGDIGESIFFISLEDDLAVRFGGEKMKKIFQFFIKDEDSCIETKMLSRQIEAAQRNIEGRNFGIRKNVIQYDDVNNKQREIIYAERLKVLNGEDIHARIVKFIDPYVREILAKEVNLNHMPEKWDLEHVNQVLEAKLIPEGSNYLTPQRVVQWDSEIAVQKIIAKTKKEYDKKIETLKESMHLDFNEIERQCFLMNIDKNWIEQIDAMEHLRKGIVLHAYGNIDPVLAFKKEGFEMFDEMIQRIQNNTIALLLKLRVQVEEIVEADLPQHSSDSMNNFVQPIESIKAKSVLDEQPVNTNQESEKQPQQPVRVEKTVGRNDPCPCGSGKKYKNCHGK